MKESHKPKPLIVAHRGSSGSAPENTMASFRLAIDEGADMIELDIRMTKDFHLIVHHDRDLGRTVRGTGYIREKTLNELKALDAGSWFSPKFRGEQIPTLREVMDILPPHMKLNIEVKTDGETRQDIAFEESCILIVREKQFTERVIISSFDHKFLKRLHRLDPAIITGALLLPVRDMAKKPSSLARSIGTKAFICNTKQLRRRHIQDAHKHHIWVACYSVNTRPQLERMLRLGVDAVVTDFPGRMRRAIRSATSAGH